MNIKINTRREEQCLKITVQTIAPIKLRLKMYSYEHPKTVFTNRFKTVSGIDVFYVRLPISSKNVVLAIYNEAKGNLPAEEDQTFKVLEIEKIPLEKRTDISDLKDVETRSFVDFAQRFAYNASYLEGDQAYISQDGVFTIDYQKGKLKSDRTGKELATPARISKFDGTIQISKQLFDKYTLPMRMAILLHEFAHFYVNHNIDDEMEADMNGLIVYLSLGYPRIDAFEAYYEVFNDTPSQQNKERYQMINDFIRDFEHNKILIN